MCTCLLSNPLARFDQHRTAIDLGCGRGEWLELMREIGFDAIGIDVDEAMLAACRELGLATQTGDAIAYLKALPDESVVLVSAFHLVEHIPFASLQSLVQEALRVLTRGGLLILETPNPENIVVATTNFYLDPTHQRPIPPLLLSFLAEHYGFDRVKIVRLQEPRELTELQSPTLLDVLSGPSMDFAVVSQKRADLAEPSGVLDAAFQREYGIDLNTLVMRYDNEMSGKLSEILLRVDRAAEFEASERAAMEQLHAMKQELASYNGEKHVWSTEKSILTAQLEQLRSEYGKLESKVSAISEEREDALAEIRTLTADRAAQLDQMRSEYGMLESKVGAITEEFERARAETIILTKQLDEARSELRDRDSAMGSATDALHAEVAALTARLDAMQRSTSWKLTAPLRGLKRMVSRH